MHTWEFNSLGTLCKHMGCFPTSSLYPPIQLPIPHSLLNNHWRGDDASSIKIWTCSFYAKWQTYWQKSNKQTQMMTNHSYILYDYITASQFDLIGVTEHWSHKIKCSSQIVIHTCVWFVIGCVKTICEYALLSFCCRTLNVKNCKNKALFFF